MITTELDSFRIYMLSAKYGFVQSTDCAAQTMDPYFMLQSMDYTNNPWIARIQGRKHAKYKFADNPWIALRKLIATGSLAAVAGPVQG